MMIALKCLGNYYCQKIKTFRHRLIDNLYLGFSCYITLLYPNLFTHYDF